MDRRFQLRGKIGGIAVVDDYGHHPTEIRATLAAARQCKYGKIHVVFQPHRYTRTQSLMDQFAGAFKDCDSLFLLNIYPASEHPIEGISSAVLARKIVASGDLPTSHLNTFEDAVAAVAAIAQPGDLILTLGAGNVGQIAPMILEKLQNMDSSPIAAISI